MIGSDDTAPIRNGTKRSVDTRLLALVALATILGIGHHVDHAIRGNHVGWPLTSEVTVFTYSLAFYPLIAVGLYLTLTRRVGAGYWLFLTALGVLVISLTHFGPWAVEPPHDVVGPHGSAVVGYLAVGLVIALIGTLLVATVYAARRRRRGTR